MGFCTFILTQALCLTELEPDLELEYEQKPEQQRQQGKVEIRPKNQALTITTRSFWGTRPRRTADMDEGYGEHRLGWARIRCRGGRAIQFWKICFECHEVLDGPVKKSRVPGGSDLPLWSFKQWCDWRGVDQSAKRRVQSWWTGYRAYMKSSVWRAKRRERLDLDDGLCGCGSAAEHVHHLSYKRLGDERMDDLRSVCRACHSRIHGRSV